MRYEKIIFCADRPDRGAGGGAAGVMFLLRKYLRSPKLSTEYLYRNENRLAFIRSLIQKAICERKTYYICHEPDSAAILGLLRKPYSMVYHQQGPITQEYVNHESNPTRFKIAKKKFIEKTAFLNADKVYFPSSGAAMEYFSSPYATVDKTKVVVGEPLYNTISLDEDMIPIDEICADPQSVTFLSVGTMSKLKGQDLTFSFIEKLVNTISCKVRWITVGDGLIKNEVFSKARDLEQRQENFTYIHFDKLPHGSVLYLGMISDAYIMLHRSSIFDLATLEAMNNCCAIILSDIGGNRDFNKESNCIMVDLQNISKGVGLFLNADISVLKNSSKKVFDEYFSPTCFSERYANLSSEICCDDM